MHENERTHCLLEQKRMKNEIAGADAQAGERAAAILAASEEEKGLEQKLESLQKEEQLAREEQQKLLEKGKSYDSETGDLQAKLSALALDISRFSMTITASERSAADERLRLREAEDGIRSAEEKTDQQKAAIAEVDGLLEEIVARRESLTNTEKGLQIKFSGKEDALKRLQQQYQDLELEEKGKLQRANLLRDLEENMEGFAHSVKSVLNWQKNGVQKGVHGTVAQLISVPSQYALAIETALGGALQNLIVADEETAKSCIRRLQREKAGRATFLPLTSVKGTLLDQPGLDREPGFVGLASELIETDPAYRGIARFLLGRIVIASDLDAASDMAKKNRYRFRVVTLDGQQVNVGGSFTGGSAARTQGLLSRRGEAAALRKEADDLRSQKQAVAQKGRELKAELDGIQAQIEGTRSELIVAGEDYVRFEGEKKRCETELQSAGERMESFRAQAAQCKEKLAAVEQESHTAADSLAKAKEEKQSVESRLTSRQGRQDQLSTQLEQLAARLSAFSVRRVVLEKDLEAARMRKENLGKERAEAAARQQQLKQEVQKLEETLSGLENSIKTCKQEIETFTGQIADYEKKNEQILAERTRLEGETISLRQKSREASLQKERAAGEQARLDEQKQTIQRDYDHLVSRLWEEYELTPREAEAVRVPMESVSEGNRQLGILKNRIKALGSINVAAIEEYREVSGRYAFLKTQVDDAAGARDELLQLIENLTSEMKTIFGTAFETINRNFGKIFAELFGGGNASLQLEDPEDVLECGIEIIVQPPGKIIKNLAALSGGEQAMVAVAIYFAILKVRPSPFCVLDEIEAALDDVNVSRYAAYLRSICDKTQFILITHRRGTMEQADVLYGVTMQESGVSRLLQLKISQLSSENLQGQL